MIKIFRILLLTPLLGLAMTVNASAIAWITDGPPPAPPGGTVGAIPLNGINGLIDVTEQEYFNEGGNGIEYSVNILNENSSLAIISFGISTNTQANSNNDISSSRDGFLGWSGEQMTAAQWDIIYGLNSFASLFGTDGYVNYFSVNQGTSITAANDENFEFFHSYGALASNFVAFNANGGIVDQSRTPNNVPEPAPMALLGLGLMGLGLMRRRRK